MEITESTLEMHYHHDLIECFKNTYGLGKSGKFNFYKYSTQNEKFIGFDQAFIRSELSNNEMLEELKNVINGRSKAKFFGYILQFKVVHQKVKINSKYNGHFTSTPYYISKIDSLKKGKQYSQHEILCNLASKGLDVYYACPMLFDKEDLYNRSSDLDTLVLCKINNSTPLLNDNDNHALGFSDLNGNGARFFSEVSLAKTVNVEKMFSTILENKNSNLKMLIQLIDNKLEIRNSKALRDAVRGKNQYNFLKDVGECFNLIMIK
jgi:hypothetical protein